MARLPTPELVHSEKRMTVILMGTFTYYCQGIQMGETY